MSLLHQGKLLLEYVCNCRNKNAIKIGRIILTTYRQFGLQYWTKNLKQDGFLLNKNPLFLDYFRMRMRSPKKKKKKKKKKNRTKKYKRNKEQKTKIIIHSQINITAFVCLWFNGKVSQRKNIYKCYLLAWKRSIRLVKPFRF